MIQPVKSKRVQFDPNTSLDELIKEYTLAALDYFRNDKQQAADALKITKRTLDGWLKEWNVREKYYVNRLNITTVWDAYRKHDYSTKNAALALRVSRQRVYQMFWSHGLINVPRVKSEHMATAQEITSQNDVLPKGAA